MPRRIANTTLNASTIDILNVIRQNASLAYQSSVPTVTQEADIPAVGEVLYGYPALQNEFINALINRIALVRTQSAVFNNPYARLKKGMLEYGETVEEIFAGLARVVHFSPEKAEARELKRYIPDVKAAFHVINWKTLYPLSIEEEQLRLAFLSADGVTDMIARIVDQIYTAASYDEFLLFKYLLIKKINAGYMYPVAVDDSDIRNAAISFRGTSNVLPFLSAKYNVAGVMNTTPKDRQIIFMDSFFNAQYDVNVLASAFNMEKADFMGRLQLIDDFTTFDNERWTVIRSESTGLEEVTAEELAVMQNVIAILGDEEWFQFYDNLAQFREKYVAAGLRWNYFYHVWKTISVSPFANMIVFVKDSATISAPTEMTYAVQSMDTDDAGNIVVNLAFKEATGGSALTFKAFQFIQTEDAVEKMVAVHSYGSIVIPDGVTTVDLEVSDGTTSLVATVTVANLAVGGEIDFEPESDGSGSAEGSGSGT